RGFRAAYLLLDELGFPVARSRRLGSAFAGTESLGIRWVLYPKKATEKDMGLLDQWLRQGGVMLLADDRDEFARQLGIDLQVQFQEDGGAVRAAGLIAGDVAGGKTWVDWPGQAGEVVAQAGGKPLITIHRRGLGEIWLAHRPELVTNELLKKADNGTLVCR